MQNKTSPTALVVNDDPLQLRLTAALLEKEGIRPLTCSSVEEALRTLDTQQSVDLIITDLHMPKIDGWRFCRLLRSPEYARYNTIPILVMSATLAGSDAEQITADLGANAFLSIPYNPSTFRAQVRALLKGETPRATLQVLLVEDSPTQAKILRQAFEAHGYVVRRARLGAEGRRLFQRYQPEIVVLDYHLPDMTADHLLEEIKEAVPTTVVIMITGNPTPELALRFMKQGADGYLRKPFDPAYLVRLCEKARRERSLLQVEDLLKARTQELQESEARFRGLFDSIPEIVLVHDQQGEILHVNTFGAQRLAWRPVELIGKNLRELVPPEAISLLAQHLRHTLQEGKHDFEMTYITRTGEALAVEVSERCIEFGGEQAVLSVARDVTERKQAIAALKAAKEYAENLINSSLDMIISVDLDRRIIEFNRAAEQTFGYRKAEVLGKPVDILYADPVEGRRTHQRALRIQGFTGEITNRRKNGETFSSYLSASVLRNGAGEVIGVMGISRDITQSKRTETELKRLVTAVEQVAEGIIITDPQGIIYYVNPAFEQITGYRRAEVTGEHIGLLKPDPNDHTLCQAIQQVMESGEAWSGRMTSRKKDGTLFEGETTISPVRDITGNLVNHVAVLRDVTQEVELETQLRQTQKMEAIGQLAGGIAHDFNNLLTGILGYANLLKLNAQPGEQIYQAAEVIERAAERGAQLTAQLLGFARRGKYQHVAVDMHEIVQEVIRLLSRTIDKRITITHRFRTRKALVLGDPNQMQQMVLNLALNARDAMPEGGELLFTLDVVIL
ncbi:MAG: PAS domain S-box protein, partial [Nitrospinota bacterium]